MIKFLILSFLSIVNCFNLQHIKPIIPINPIKPIISTFENIDPHLHLNLQNLPHINLPHIHLNLQNLPHINLQDLQDLKIVDFGSTNLLSLTIVDLVAPLVGPLVGILIFYFILTSFFLIIHFYPFILAINYYLWHNLWPNLWHNLLDIKTNISNITNSNFTIN